MAIAVAGLVALVLSATGCLNSATGAKGDANVQVTLERVGLLGKATASQKIEMKSLILSLRAPGEATRRDTLTLTGNSQQSVVKTYANLTTKKTWTLEAIAKDTGGISIYRDSVKFTVPPEGTTEVNLDLKSTYTMLRANFFPIRDSVTRCQLWVDGGLVADSSFPKQSRVGDTVILTRDYLLAYPPGRLGTVRMDVYGDWFGEKNILLYRGEVTFPVYPGRDTTYNITLFRVGPPAPIGQGKITVTLGMVGTTSLRGYLDPSSWGYLGPKGLTSGEVRSISLSFSDTMPLVAYSDAGLSGKASVRVWDGLDWTEVGSSGFSQGAATNISLVVQAGTPYVAFQDSANAGKATVMRWNGSTWVAVGSPGFSPDSALRLRFAMNGGTPYVAFQDAANGGKATVMRWDGTAWSTVGSPGFTTVPATYLSLALSGSTPYIAFQDAASEGKVTVMRWSGSAWSIVGTAGISAEAVDFVTIAASDVDSSIFVGYRHGNRPGVTRWDGSTWSLVGSFSFSPGYLPYFDMTLHGGTPYVVFPDGTKSFKATMMRWNGVNWEIMAGTGVSNGSVDTILAGVSSNGTPFMAFRDNEASGKLSVMRFAEFEYDDCCIGGGLAKARAR